MRRYVLVVVALALTCAAARADDAPMRPVAGGVEPVQRTDIVMEKESVRIRVSDAEHTLIVVDCTFWFHNTGKATTVLMGFPAFGHYAGGPTMHPGRALRATPESAFHPITLHDFLTFVGDRHVPVKLKRGLRKDERWVTWSLGFAAGERKVVRNRYWVNEGGSTFWYLLHTGAGWKGKIREAKVIIENGLDEKTGPDELNRLKEAGELDRLTPGYRIQGRDVVWEFRDFEPTVAHDIAWPIGSDGIDVLPHASSWLPGSQEAFYGPDFAFDGAPGTCWAVKGPGIGEWIKGATNWNAGTSQFVGIDILPGHAANQAAWQENNRVAKISIVALHYPKGDVGQAGTEKPRTVTHSANLRDEMKVQRVHFDPPIITYPSEIKVFIAGIHRGSKHDHTCISELAGARRPQWLERALTEADLRVKSPAELRDMRNEIYARRGREFQNLEIRRYFYRQSWYEPNPKYTDALLSEVDRANIALIRKVEKDSEESS